MDSFIHLHTIYLSASRWKVIARIYTESRVQLRILMWSAKAILFGLAAYGVLASSWLSSFFAIIVMATIWAVSFHKARSEVFADLYPLYSERLKYFSRNYQYVRYLTFKDCLESNSLMGRVEEALAFVDGQNDANPHPSTTSHPFITFTLGAILAIVGGVAGQWTTKDVAVTILVMAAILYFSFMVLDLTRTPASDLKEFRQFLLWARNEQ